MISFLRRLLAAVACGVLGARELRAADVASLPPAVHRVVFVGDSITYAGTYVCDIAAYFATRQPRGNAIEFINVGLPSETVSGLSEEGHAGGKFPRPDLHERLGRVLAATKPDLVFACYGMNDGIYLPLADERFQKFQDGMRWLHEQVRAAGARIIHITPPVYDETGGNRSVGYAAVLDRYSEWLMDQRADAQWDVIDVHTPLREFIAARRKQESEFHLAQDGIHPNELGHWLIAREILRHLGARDVADAPSAAAMVAAHPHGAEILKLVTQRHTLLRDAWLTATGHRRPGIKAGLPLAEAEAQAADLSRQIERLQ